MVDEKQKELSKMIEDFCDEYLNEECKKLSLKLIEKMTDRKNVYFHSGKLEVWASAIIYAISQVNSLFDDSNELHITRKDIFKFFNTSQSAVSRKAINLRDIFNMDKEFVLSKDDSDYDVYERYSNIMNHHFGKDWDAISNYKTVGEYQKAINAFKQHYGKKFFKQHEGHFWAIPETRSFMQCLLNQAELFWDMGEREKAVDQYKYMLKLNPNDNHGVRYSLLPNLIELNRLDEAEELYLEFYDERSANWKFCKLLMDIKNNLPFEEIQSQYEICISENPYVVPFLLGDKDLPDDLPPFYGVGDENEAVFYIALAASAWIHDGNAMRVLEKLNKN